MTQCAFMDIFEMLEISITCIRNENQTLRAYFKWNMLYKVRLVSELFFYHYLSLPVFSLSTGECPGSYSLIEW